MPRPHADWAASTDFPQSETVIGPTPSPSRHRVRHLDPPTEVRERRGCTMNAPRLLGALVLSAAMGSSAWAANPISLTTLKNWTAQLTGASASAGCDDCDAAHVCCRDDACRVAELISQLKTDCKPRHRERAAARLDHYQCCCYPEIVPALIEALSDCDADVREEAAESLGELKCCTPEVTGALEGLLGDCDRGVRREARKALKRCGVCVVEVKPCPVCGGCAGCGTCVCGAAGAVMHSDNVAEDAAPAPAPHAEGEPQARVIPYHPDHGSSLGEVFEQPTGLRRLFGFGRL